MKSKKKKKWLIGVTSVFLVLPLLFADHVRSALSREKNPSEISKAALQLEFTGAKFVLVSDNPQEVSMRSNSTKPLDIYMSDHGWHRAETIQMGAAHYFAKGREKMKVVSHGITGRYRFYKLEAPP